VNASSSRERVEAHLLVLIGHLRSVVEVYKAAEVGQSSLGDLRSIDYLMS
jgi:hypothetical protein